MNERVCYSWVVDQGVFYNTSQLLFSLFFYFLHIIIAFLDDVTTVLRFSNGIYQYAFYGFYSFLNLLVGWCHSRGLLVDRRQCTVGALVSSLVRGSSTCAMPGDRP